MESHCDLKEAIVKSQLVTVARLDRGEVLLGHFGHLEVRQVLLFDNIRDREALAPITVVEILMLLEMLIFRVFRLLDSQRQVQSIALLVPVDGDVVLAVLL